ncbi:MAG TPA: hypothetical protein V6C85_06525 [Allocoleopsis sp.]
MTKPLIRIVDDPVKPLPKIKHTPEFDEIFQSSQTPVITCRPKSDIERIVVEMISGQWVLWLHWVIKKKWLSKHKIPTRRGYTKLYEPRGELLYRILELCLQLHSSKWGGNYRNAFDWFHQYLEFERSGEIELVLKSDSDSKKGWKRSYQKAHRACLISLRDGVNPYHKIEEPHIYRLMEAALPLAEQSDIFEANFWKPFLRAYTAWIRSHDGDDWASCWVDGDKLRIQDGKGQNNYITLLPAAFIDTKAL